MREVSLIYDESLASYDFGPTHPFKPQRFTNSIALIRAYGLTERMKIVAPVPASEEDLLRVHSQEYLETLRTASHDPDRFLARLGLGTSDNPVFAGMWEAGMLVCGSAIECVERVAEGSADRAFSIAGGLHHAHRSRAAGFCVVNDVAVAIARLLEEHPSSRVFYLDIDAHHGDGVQEAFYEESRVMTLSVHESGHYLFPGTGFPTEVGEGDGKGFAANVPLPPRATDDCYMTVFEEVIAPLAASFSPDLIVLQAGADAHHSDPLTTLGMTLSGYSLLTSNICALADDLCRGRLAAFGGGGYAFATVVPRAWTLLSAHLMEVDIPEELPEFWEPDFTGSPDMRRPTYLSRDDEFPVSAIEASRLYEATMDSVRALKHSLAPYHTLD